MVDYAKGSRFALADQASARRSGAPDPGEAASRVTKAASVFGHRPQWLGKRGTSYPMHLDLVRNGCAGDPPGCWTRARHCVSIALSDRTSDGPPGGSAARLAPLADRRLQMPRAAGIAGLAFAALFVTSVVLLRSHPSAGSTVSEIGDFYLRRDAGRVALVGVYLAPFSGIAFCGSSRWCAI